MADPSLPDLLEPPPRLSSQGPNGEISPGEFPSALSAVQQYLWSLYKNLILSGGVVLANKQATGSYNVPAGRIEAFPVGSVFITTATGDPAQLLGYGTWQRFGKGKTLLSQDDADVDFKTIEGTGGEKLHTLTTAEMPSHTHVQDAHTHVQDPHTHVQNAHNHTQDPHHHTQQVKSTPNDGTSGSRGGDTANDTSVGRTDDTTATNQAATATNQNATATNQNTTATNQSTGGGTGHNNMPPYVVVFIWRRTA